jgi:hypothetical protein
MIVTENKFQSKESAERRPRTTERIKKAAQAKTARDVSLNKKKSRRCQLI